MDPGSIPGISTSKKSQANNLALFCLISPKIFDMINIRPLSNLELPKFLEFMDGPAFASQPQWAGCYCQTYLNRNGEELPAKQNRELACQRIASGVMQGYLAFEAEGPEEKVIGWMAANKNNNFAALPPSEESTATIICF
ncbi:MAG: hypothetical protein RL418_179, partial [Actinomycetota bacterium]